MAASAISGGHTTSSRTCQRASLMADVQAGRAS